MKILFYLLLITPALIFNPSASAHFVKSDVGIGAVLHVDPADDPVAGEQSNIILEFKDTNNQFNLNNCNCKIIVSKGEGEILNQDLPPVAADQELSSVTPITFPKKNIYKLKILGSSKDNTYPEFELNYDIRVEKEVSPSLQNSKPANWWTKNFIYLAGGLLVLSFLIFALTKQSLQSHKRI